MTSTPSHCSRISASRSGALLSDLQERLRYALLPASPATRDLAALFPLLLGGDDTAWLERLGEPTLKRIAALAFDEAPGLEPDRWRRTMVDALLILVASIQAAGFAPPLRQRMSRERNARPSRFASCRVRPSLVRDAVLAGERDLALREASYLRRCSTPASAPRRASPVIWRSTVFRSTSCSRSTSSTRCRRIEQLLDCVPRRAACAGVAPPGHRPQPAPPAR